MLADYILFNILLLDLAPQLFQVGKVPESLHPADDFPGMAFQDIGAQPDWLLHPLFGDDLGRKIDLRGLSAKRLAQRAVPFANIGPKDIEAVLPNGLLLGKTGMVLAARLNEVIRLWASMVKTPSLMLSRIVQQGVGTTEVMSQKAGPFSEHQLTVCFCS